MLPAMSPLLALACAPSAAALTLGDIDPQPIMFPSGKSVPRNAFFRVLWPADPTAVWLEDDRGRRVPTRRHRRAFADGRAYTELRPRRPLAENRTYCVIVRLPGWRMDDCVRTAAVLDDTAPTGAAITRVAVGGGEVWFDIENGVEASEVALELEVIRGGAACSDLLPVWGAYLRLGGTVDIVPFTRRTPGPGIACFEGLPDPSEAASLRTRWIDAAGNASSWSGTWELPAGRSPLTVQEFVWRGEEVTATCTGGTCVITSDDSG